MSFAWNSQAPEFVPVASKDEGCGSTMGTVEAALAEFLLRQPGIVAKQHGPVPSMDCGPFSQKTTRKRSYIRAATRAKVNGFCWYHGRCLTSLDFQHLSLPLPADNQVISQPLAHTHVPKRRLKIFSWNAGGLSSLRYWELLRWLHAQQFDLVILQESRWG